MQHSVLAELCWVDGHSHVMYTIDVGGIWFFCIGVMTHAFFIDLRSK